MGWPMVQRVLGSRIVLGMSSNEHRLGAGLQAIAASGSVPKGVRNGALARLQDSCAGNAIVEMALTMPIMAFMLMGLIKTGLAFNNYLILESAVNQGAYAVANNATDHATLDPCNLAYNAVSSVTPQFTAAKLQFSMQLNGDPTAHTGTGSSFNCTLSPTGKLKAVVPDDPVVLTVSYPVDMMIMGVNFLPGSLMSATSQQNVQVFTP